MKHAVGILMILLFSITTVSADQIVITTSDYGISGNTAVYNSDTGIFYDGILGQSDQDTVVDTDGEYIYFISRTLGSVSKYHPFETSGESASGQMIWQYSVGSDTNPYDIVFLENKAYVIRQASSEILVIDQNASDEESFITGTIDISMYDEVGVPEAAYGFEYNSMVYVVLQRLNGYTADKPGYLIAINPVNDAILDLVPETNGIQGIELLVKNPQSFSQVGSVAYISGHDWAGQTEGVQSIDFATDDFKQAMLLDEALLSMDITAMQVFDENLGICFTPSWVEQCKAYWFDPVTGTLGAALPVPTPDGGAVQVGDIVYVGSRDDAEFGIYPVNPITNTLFGTKLATTLPPTSMVIVDDNTQTVVAENPAAPESFVLDLPYPNPFNPTTTIPFILNMPGMTRIDVLNIAGQHVDTIAHEYMSAGNHAVIWNGAEEANGVYFISVRHGDTVKTTKATLLK